MIKYSTLYIQCSPYKIAINLCCTNGKADPKIHLELQLIAKTKLERVNKVRRHTAWFLVLLQSSGNQTTHHWHKDRHIDQWNRLSPEINHISMVIWLSTDVEVQQRELGMWKTVFSKWCRENKISTCRRTNLDPYITSYRKQFKMEQT